MVDETDLPNYKNLPSNNEKLSLPFTKASYTVALALAKQFRPFDDGNFFLNFTTDVLSCFGEKCQEAVKLCQNISLSRCTIPRGTNEISKLGSTKYLFLETALEKLLNIFSNSFSYLKVYILPVNNGK